jgi:type I restriction enzyme R subunit
VQHTLARVTQVRGDATRPGGVIWHTTGSGKSLTMVMLAKALALEPDIANPKIILVTDRVDLDDQIYKTFLACQKPVKRATSGENLFDLIEHNRATMITTIVDKFEAASRKRNVKDESHDIFILVDESHRSQYGVSHAKMRNVFPNACYIGFTGTPLLKKEKSTARKFGGFIHTYSMRKAVEDGAVTPLLYEGRMSELHGDQAQLDRWFERITDGLTDEQKLDLKKKFRREEELAKSNQRLAEIAYDIGQHYNHTFKGSGLKGQLAVSSKVMAIRYKRLLDEFGEVSAEVIMSAPDTREGNADTDEAKVPEVEQFWHAMMARYGNKDAYENRLISAFKHSDEPELLIVVDKLLTGFDAPRNAVLYLDKRLREHNILQAIARVNRLFEGKQHGLIIDYRGIFGELNDAIDTYTALEQEGFEAEDVDTVLTNVREEIQQLPQRHSDVWAVFNELSNKDDIEALQLHLEPLDRREQFYEALSGYARILQLALGNAHFQEHTPEDKIRRYRHDLKFFLNLRTAVKQRFGESVDYSSFEIQIRNMVNKYIGADEVRQLVAPVDVFAVEQLEAELNDIEGDAGKADAIAARMRKTITERMEEDPALYKRLSELIDEAIAEHRAKRLSDAELLSRMRSHLDELRGQETRDLPPVLYGAQDAKAYYGLVKEPMGSYAIKGQSSDDLAADMAVHLERLINQHKVRDWTMKDDVQNAMLNAIEDYLFSIKGRYDLEMDYDTIDRIMQDVLTVAKRRECQP